MSQHSEQAKHFPWIYMLLMSSVTFMAILSELVPSGVLPQMGEGLNVPTSEVGLLVTAYGVASAIGTIPLITWTMEMNRKKLLIIVLIVFGISNMIIVFSSNFYLTAFARILGGASAGIVWPMMTAYAIRLVPKGYNGRAIAVVMGGSTVGLGVGLPIMTTIGTTFGWRIEYGVLAGIFFLIALLVGLVLPSAEGEKRTKETSPFQVAKNKSVLIVLVVTFFTMMAHYGLYTYLSPLVESFNLSGGVNIATLIFGIGTILSVILTAKVIDKHLGGLNLFILSTGLAAMILFAVFKGTFIIAHISFFLWGVAFGPLVTLFQDAVARQVDKAKDIATSLQSSIFNTGIVVGSAVGSALLSNFSVYYIVILSLVLLIISIVVSALSKKTFFTSH
ncbi:MFS transporter [Alkalibacterium kapii]|uniref:Purine efflux pump PbuE n=1 Tax=Alkalibacterium kapii TaxID=426704 RepID=A0A511AST0_9LACT|nr:MFS transporter [Alkalibacterium kapii]GEK91255.1 purine efflux pump PbuE [Alkalibacterium kapii]